MQFLNIGFPGAFSTGNETTSKWFQIISMVVIYIKVSYVLHV